MHRHYGEMNEIAQQFRLMKPGWSVMLDRMFAEVRAGMYTNDELLHLLDYFRSCMSKVMEELPHEMSIYWSESILPDWNRAEERESYDEIVLAVTDLCQQAYQSFAELVSTKSGTQTIHHIREYLESNYWNSDLSLTYLSEKFNLSSKYASQLFKEHMGVNFADYLLSIRLEHAKRLLEHSDQSINDIAALVGYDIPLSFGRTFKKSVGMSPSEYRKHMNTAIKRHAAEEQAEKEEDYERLRETRGNK